MFGLWPIQRILTGLTPEMRYAFDEMKFIRSFDDLMIFVDKFRYLAPRVTGSLVKYKKAPPSLQIEPTNHCNLNCICCSTSRSSRARGYMKLDLFCKIVDDASEVGIKRIHLYLHGEPMLHPRIVDMVSYAKSRGLAVHLTTNGMLFEKAKAEEILESGVNRADHFKFSVLGYSKEVHEKLMKGVNHQIVLEHIFEFLRLRKAFKMTAPVIEVVMYRMHQNEHEKDEFLEFWRGTVDHVHLAGNISVSFADYDKKPGLDIARSATCSKIWERLTVYWNGEVGLCGQDLDGRYILGDLKEDSILDIWNSKKLSSIKGVHERREFNRFEMCYRCDA